MGNVLILDSVIFSVLLHCWPSLILLPATFDLNSLRNSYFTQTLAVFFFFLTIDTLSFFSKTTVGLLEVWQGIHRG